MAFGSRVKGPRISPQATVTRKTNTRRTRRVEWVPLAMATVLALAVSVVKFNHGLNAGYDTYAFLCNAAHMAGQSVGYLEPSRPPLMSFLASLVMRAGVGGETSLLLADVSLAAVGVVAMYFLLARRFTGRLAAAGALLFVGMPPYWAIVGTGMTDNVAVAVSVLAVLAMIRATEVNPRWYWIAFPLTAAAFLMRYGALLMIVPIGLWLVFRSQPIKHAKHIAGGVVSGIAVYCVAGYWYLTTQGNFMYPFQLAGMVAEGQFAAGGQYSQGQGTAEEFLARVIPGQWYLQNLRELMLPDGMGIIAAFVLLLTAAGLLIGVTKALSASSVKRRWIAPVAATLLVLATQSSGSTGVRMLAIVGLGAAVAWCTRPRNDDGTVRETSDYRWALDATMLVWGLTFFDAHGHMAATVDRYFLTMMPPVVYFVLESWRTLAAQFVEALELGPKGGRSSLRSTRPDLRTSALASALVIAIAASAAYFAFTTPPPSASSRGADLIAGLKECAQWLQEHDARVEHKIVMSTAFPHMSWYLGQYVTPMPPHPDTHAVEWELEKRRADYFVLLGAKPYPGYEVAFTGTGKVSVLRRTDPFDETAARVLYLGRGWDTYLERVTDYDFQLMYGRRRGLATDEWWLDRPRAEDMAAYDAVAIYGVEWKNRSKGERELRRYVEQGGVVIIDASRNVSSISNNLVDTTLVDTVIRRVRIPETGRITFENGFVRGSGSTESVDAARFSDESGGPWYGTVYQPVNEQAESQTQVLARLNGDPLVTVQHVGRGRVYWIGANLVWHAYLSEKVPHSPQRVPGSPESDIIRGVLRAALDLSPAPSDSARDEPPKATATVEADE